MLYTEIDMSNMHVYVQDMMIHPCASYVIQKMVAMAEEHQVRVLVGVARDNMANLKRYPPGRNVIAFIEKFLSDKGMQCHC